MRLDPPVPMIMRELDKPMEFEGVSLLPGTGFAINVHNIHHNPHVWGEDHDVIIHRTV